jgi:hypothetical protein
MALEMRFASVPQTVISSTGSKTGTHRYSTRGNLIFDVLAVDKASADRLTDALHQA